MNCDQKCDEQREEAAMLVDQERQAELKAKAERRGLSKFETAIDRHIAENIDQK